MKWGLAVFGAALFLPTAVSSLPIVLNHTDSIPLGFYRTTHDPHSPYVGFCLDLTTLRRAQKEGLELPKGECPGDVTPILKPFVRATRERPVIFAPEGFVIDGKLLVNTAPKERSMTGVPLAHYPFGTYTSGLWTISSFNRDSYDSRYFGKVEKSWIQFWAKPLWTW